MNDERIEKYLKQSTRGLWGRKKAEVREELATHIEGRFNAHLISGLSMSDAITKSLNELGKPNNVSTGMTRLYTLPIMAVSSMFMAICFSLFMFLFTGSNAQAIEGSMYWPSEECIDAAQQGIISSDPMQDYLAGINVPRCGQVDNSLWLNLDDLKTVLLEHNIQAKQTGNSVQLSFPNKNPVFFDLGKSGVSTYDENNQIILPKIGYFDLWTLIKSVTTNPEIPLSIKGWDNPTITIDSASFQIGTSKQPFEGYDFYNNYLGKVLFNLDLLFGTNVANLNIPLLDTFAPNWDRSLVEEKQLQVNTSSESGVYGVIVVLNLKNPIAQAVDDPLSRNNSAFFYDFARVNSDNTVTLNLPNNENVQFVKELKSLPEPGEAILVNLSASNGASYKIVSPDQITLE